MRVFLICGSKYNEIKSLVKILRQNGHEICYWTGFSDDGLEIPGAIFHGHFDAWKGIPAKGIGTEEFDPPGKNLIEKMYKTESLVLTMMNKAFDKMCVDERRHLYYTILGYWHGIIKKYQPEMIFFSTVPHTVYNFIIYDLVKLLNIKTIMFEDTWISDRALMYTDWVKGSDELKKQLVINENKDISFNDLSQDLQKYYKMHMDKSQDPTPAYQKAWKKKFSGINLVKEKLEILKDSFKQGIILQKSLLYFFKQFKQNLKKEYDKLQVNIDFSKKFVYLPLNFQPERTTSPQGGMFTDQILIIEILSASLPEDWVVYVKEHPSQWWLRSKKYYNSARYHGYYKRIAQLKNVYLVPVDTDTYALINKSQAVATVTGNAGWEAVLRLKPTLIFGYPHYRDFPFLFRIKDAETCKTAFKKIAAGFKFSSQDVLRYLKSFEEATVHGYIDRGVEQNSKLNHQTSLDNLTEVILSEMKK